MPGRNGILSRHEQKREKTNMSISSIKAKLPGKVWEDPDSGVVFTNEEEREFFGDGTRDSRSAEEKREEYESWGLENPKGH